MLLGTRFEAFMKESPARVMVHGTRSTRASWASRGKPSTTRCLIPDGQIRK